MRIEFLEHNNIGHQVKTPEELLEAGVPQEIIDEAVAAIRLVEIKAEASRRIFNIASANTQMNMTGAATRIAGINPSARTSEQTAEMADYEASLDWVTAMRSNVLTLVAVPATDFKDDANWPDVPAAVAALAATY